MQSHTTPKTKTVSDQLIILASEQSRMAAGKKSHKFGSIDDGVHQHSNHRCSCLQMKLVRFDVESQVRDMLVVQVIICQITVVR